MDEKAKSMIRTKARSIQATARKMAEDENANFWQLLTLIQLDVGEIKEHLEASE